MTFPPLLATNYVCIRDKLGEKVGGTSLIWPTILITAERAMLDTYSDYNVGRGNQFLHVRPITLAAYRSESAKTASSATRALTPHPYTHAPATSTN